MRPWEILATPGLAEKINQAEPIMTTDPYNEIVKRAREVLSAEEQRRLAAERGGERPRPDAASQREALRELMAELEALPVAKPVDGVSSRDHDRLLYGS